MSPEDRKKHNEDLIRRMRRGDDLSAINKDEIFFPVRPKIKKDKKEIARLYGGDDGESSD